jgi:putative ABC transport system permease protein
VAAPREEITALLVRYRSPMAAVVLPRHVNAETALQAASPAYETARLLRLVGVGVDLVRAFALLMILAAALTLFVVLYGALEAQAADLAVMRALGATRGRVLWHVLSQGLVLGSAGTVLGLGLGHAASEALGIWLRHSRQLTFTGSHWLMSELAVVGLVLAIAVLAALPAALRAYRLDIAGVLAREA